MIHISNIQLLHGDCLELMKDIPNNSIDLIVTDPPYKCISGGKPHRSDPPYKGTTKYSVDNFPYEEFYDWCREMGKHNIVIVSEYNMPEDFECIWSKQVKTSVDSQRKHNDDKSNRTEKLFVYKNMSTYERNDTNEVTD